jgi:hypothetical protein
LVSNTNSKIENSFFRNGRKNNWIVFLSRIVPLENVVKKIFKFVIKELFVGNTISKIENSFFGTGVKIIALFFYELVLCKVW